MSSAATYRSLYVFLVDWCDYTPKQARKAVEERKAEDAAKLMRRAA